MSKVSIIIPVFNSEKHLDKCIESVINQTIVDWELILIDDGSTDKSEEIMKKHAEKDRRIHYYWKENGGVSSARNMGLDLAKGEFILFVDSDDWLNECYIESFLSRFEEKNSFIIQGYIEVRPTGFDEIRYKERIVPKDRVRNEFDFLVKENIIYSVWGKLYIRKLIDNIRFNTEFALGEDFLFNLSYLEVCDTIHIIPEANYYYNLMNESAATKRLRMTDFSQVIFLNEKAKKFKNLPAEFNHYDEIDRRLCVNIINLLQLLYESDLTNKRSIAISWINDAAFVHVCQPRYMKGILMKMLALFGKLRWERGYYLFFTAKKMLKKLIKR